MREFGLLRKRGGSVRLVVALAAQAGLLIGSADTAVVGTQDEIQKAIDGLRTVAAGAKRTIVLKGGRYLLESPLLITPADSGLLIESAPGERAELCGGRVISGWRQEKDSPLWSVTVPNLSQAAWRFRSLMVDGQIAERARLPVDGFFKDENADYVVRPGDANLQGAGDSLKVLRYAENAINPRLDISSAEVRVYFVWNESLSTISRLDAATRTMYLSTTLRYPAGAFGVHKFELLNVREGLTRQGQWFLDYGASKVYYWPKNGEKINTTRIWAPVTGVLLHIAGSASEQVKGIDVRNMDLTLTDVPATSGGFAGSGYPGAVSVENASSVTFKGLRIHDVGGSAIKVSGSTDVRVIESEFIRTGGAAIVVSGGRDVEIADCRIGDLGYSTPSAAGMHVSGNGLHLHHNEVYNTPYTGISVNGIAPVVEFNRVHHVMLLMADGSSFYLAGKDGIVRNNWAYDVGTGPGSQAPAYYLDDGTTGYTLNNNLANVTSWTLFVHNSTKNNIRDNTFISSGDQRVAFQQSTDTVFEHNVLWSGGGIKVEAADNAMSRFLNNVLYSSSRHLSLIQLDRARKEIALNTVGNVADDPGFVDVVHNKFQLRGGSTGERLKVAQPPTPSDVGPRVPIIVAPAIAW